MRIKVPKLPGVYKWTNLINGKVYIGKSVDLGVRYASYLQPSAATRNEVINLAFKKYGSENFRFDILEMYPRRTPFIEDLIVKRERFWMQIYDALNNGVGYNTCPFGVSHTGCKWTESRKKKRSDSMKGKPVKHLPPMKGKDNPMYGIKYDDERRKQCASYGFAGKKHDPSFSDFSRKMNSGRTILSICKPVKKICLATKATLGYFRSITEAAAELNIGTLQTTSIWIRKAIGNDENYITKLGYAYESISIYDIIETNAKVMPIREVKEAFLKLNAIGEPAAGSPTH
jgi:group I intron endonuclease